MCALRVLRSHGLQEWPMRDAFSGMYCSHPEAAILYTQAWRASRSSAADYKRLTRCKNKPGYSDRDSQSMSAMFAEGDDSLFRQTVVISLGSIYLNGVDLPILSEEAKP